MSRRCILSVGIALLLLSPFAAVPAQAVDSIAPWVRCELDELASELVPPPSHPLPLEQAPLQAEAAQAESSPTYSQLEGNATLARGTQRLHAERITLQRPENIVRVDSAFTYANPQQVVRGQQAQVNFNDESGWFKDADYYLGGRNAQGAAQEARVDNKQRMSWLQDATYSTCPRGSEFWELRARELEINEETKRGVARNITLAFKDVPVFYFPYLSFPITDERQSGFLPPRQGYSSETGLDLQVPYYWNIAPNQDMTLTPRYMSARGLLLGTQYRYLYPSAEGKIGIEYLPHDQRYGGERSSFMTSNRAAPLPNLYTNLRYEYVSDDSYLRDLDNNLEFLTVNYLERHLDARYFGEGWQGLARVQGYQILTPSIFAVTGNPYQRLPQLLFSGSWPLHNQTFNYGLYGEMVYFRQTDMVTGSRLDVWPRVNLNLTQSWGYIKPEASFRYTGYQLNDNIPDANDAPTRSAPILSLDSGLIFDRPLQAEWLGVSAGTQTLEPRLFYLYVPYRNQDDIPLFDSADMDRDYDWLFRRNRFVGADRLGDANQLTAALTSRLLDAESGRERLRTSIGQIQYFTNRRVGLYADAPVETADNSGLIAQANLNLSSRWSVQGGLQMEPDNRDLLRSAVSLRYYANPRQLVNFSYLLDRDPAVKAIGSGDQIDAIDISMLWPITSNWRLMARWNQALNTGRNLESLAGFEYEDCCWALRAVGRQYRFSPLDVDTQSAFYLELELKGLSKIGGGGLEGVLKNSILGYQPIN